MIVNIGFWDLLLIIVVSVQATILAYLYHPRWKAFMLTLPIPFTIASLAVGRPIDASNVLGLVLLLVFINCVRLAYQKIRLPIVFAIVIGVLSYCIIGWMIAGILPTSESAFWLSCTGTFILAVILLRLLPIPNEQGHRSPLSIWIKLPLIITVIFLLILIKNMLQGFMTVFPMVGVIAAYEARNSLRTINRQIPVFMITMIPMMIVCRLTQKSIGLGPSLALGWVAFLSVLLPMTYSMWQPELFTKKSK